VFFVVNERAGRGAGARAFAKVRPHLTPDDAFAFTTCRGDGRRIATSAAAQAHDVVVAVGGDGTINEVANGLAETGFRRVLGIIPAGGANDLAYALGIPSAPRQALALLRTGRPRAIDAGLVAYGRGQRYYVNMLGLGVSGQIAAMTSDEKRGGPLTYLIPLLRLMFAAKPVRFRVSECGRVLLRSATIAHLANGRREGRLFRIAPYAQLDDGRLELFAVGDVPHCQRPYYALRGLLGAVPAGRLVVRESVARVTIEAQDPLPCHVDGEPFILAPGEAMAVSAEQRRLAVIAPPASPAADSPPVD